MKKVIYLPVLVFVLLLNVKTTGAHSIYGTETRWRNLGNDTFEISLLVYKRCTDGAASFTPNALIITSDSCPNSYTLSSGSILSVDTSDMTPVCATQASVCLTGQSTAQIPIGVQKITYTYKIYLGGAYTNCCWYKVRWDFYSRLSNISTGYADDTLRNEIWLNRCVTNNSPRFTNDPMIIRCSAQDVVYNNGAVDDERDSLSYSLAKPMIGNYTSPWSYTYPLTCLGGNNPNINSTPPTGFNLDSITGNILFRPMQVQISVIKIEVTEWRKINGVYKIIGKTSRDISPAIIQNCNNKLPYTSVSTGLQACTGQQLCYTINTSDQDANDTTRIYSNIQSAIPGATWTTNNGSVKNATATLCWTPADSNISTLPYYFNVIVKDSHCPMYGTTSRAYSINVKQSPQFSTSFSRISGSLWKFQATPIGSYTNPTYQWFIPNLISQGIPTGILSTNQITNYTFTQDGKYLVKSKMINNGACSAERIDTIDIYCATPLQLKSNNDTTVCKGSPVILTTTPATGTAPYKFKWYSNGNLIDSVQTTVQTPFLNTMYRVEVISNDTCQFNASDTVNVSVDTTTLVITHTKDIRICAGALVVLFPQITGTKIQSYYRWYYNGVIINASKTLVHRPPVSGIYVFEIQSNGFCAVNVKDTINILVDTNKLALIHMRDTLVCSGVGITLSPVIKTGQPPFSYKWFSKGIQIGTTQSITIIETSTSKYIVEVNSGDSCSSFARDTVTVALDTVGLVANSLNDSIICKGSSIQLTPKIISGKTPLQYFWYKNNVLISTGATLIDTPMVATSYALKIISSNNCNNAFYDTVNVSFHPNTLQIKIPRDTTVCANVPVTLKAQVNGASLPYNYNWCPQGKACSILPEPVYNFDATTQVILEVTASDLCNSVKRDTMTVHVYPLKQITITAGSTNINKGQSTVLKSNALFSFNWSGVGIITNWGDSVLVKPTSTSTYYLIGMNVNGCRDTAQIIINVNNVGLKELGIMNYELGIYPNPATTELTLFYSLRMGGKYSVYNTLGQIMLQGELNENETIIDIRSLSEGLYFIGVGSNVRKFVKK